MQSRRPNPFATARRATKAARLAIAVYEMSGGPLTDEGLAFVRTWSLVDWAAIAARAGVNAPSSDTVRLILDTLDRARGLRRAA